MAPAKSNFFITAILQKPCDNICAPQHLYLNVVDLAVACVQHVSRMYGFHMTSAVRIPANP